MSDIIEQLVHYQLATVNHTGLPWSPIFDNNGIYLLIQGQQMPLFFFGYDFKGLPAHMSYTYEGGLNNSVSLNFRHSPKNSTIMKREQFNEQDFSTESIEAGFSYNQEYNGGWLDPSNDYGQMDHEVSCYYSDLNSNGIQF